MFFLTSFGISMSTKTGQPVVISQISEIGTPKKSAIFGLHFGGI
nr:hypothetical protein [Fervidicola ferrireducens]